MATSGRDEDRLARAARLYFIDGLSQQEVADALKTTRSNVSRMLTAAKERGVVQIRIVDTSGRDVKLETALTEELGLSEALVARVPPSAVGRAVGQLGATWLMDRIHDGQTLAVSWGQTLQNMVWEVTADQSYDVEIVQMVGGLSHLDTSPTGHELVRELAARLGAHYRYLHAPVVLDRPEGVAALMAERSISGVLETVKRADIALVGVGSAVSGSTRGLVEDMGLTAAQRAEFDAADPAGAICARFYDGQGRPIHGAANDRVLGVTLEDLRAIPTVFGIATGAQKAAGLLGAIRGGLLDVVCCDVAAARAVLELHRGGNRSG